MLYFENTWFPSHPLWMTLTRLLPACRTIYQRMHGYYNIPLGHLSHSAALKSSLRGINSFVLFRCSFLSSRTLFRVLGDITHLEAVDLEEVIWSGNPLMTFDTANNICSGTFNSIRLIELQNCTNNLAVPAWFLAAASTHHSFIRRLAGPAVTVET
ncbi:uncharacterized protein PHACADRAFT_259755 [Phanerochaete carnosa HHB-10118-sp]|uniref:Uncharacterized protein n=1 Tax=Phanerochaete carnosa (strain HHB-10118-sp) TaxID=650164 RepID=K5W3A7_PHACS|nr:uncharacterized protein PHACADRAFT_259755 [Phanerochaete carnosa HHB-10118-sp]EKM53399.1 hypothetical protein PHACADRAFT_259755 [Phanerochaete carnosa HHB-10118-sp]